MIEAWVDVGGTFTDCLIELPDGERRQCKVLSNGIVPCTEFQFLDDRTVQVGSNDCDPAFQRRIASWTGASLAVRRRDGSLVLQSIIESAGSGHREQSDPSTSTSCRLTLQTPIPESDRESSASLEINLGVDAPVVAIRHLLGRPIAEELPAMVLRLGTTRGTNALLERTGAKVAFVTTDGFGDLLEIGTQQRDDLFALRVTKRPSLYSRSIELVERVDANGQIRIPLDIAATTNALRGLLVDGVTSLAVCFLHSYKNSAHERQVFEIATQLGFEHISLSSEVSPLIGAVPRAETTVINAYLTPVVLSYLHSIRQQLGSSRATQFHVMTSAGGLVDYRDYLGKDSVLSGPAGGVVALAGIASATANSLAIGFDMGGTSTDVSRFADGVQLQYESTKAGVRLLAPTLDIHTVAAGGGSICWFDGVQMRVGPNSAGAFPGPACYGSGGTLTLTDLNFLLGRIDADAFPFALDYDAAETRLEEISASIQDAFAGADSNSSDRGEMFEVNDTIESLSMDHLASGFRRIANAAMAEAIREITISQGSDPRDHVLIGFGGAAGQHVCEIAEQLGIETIIDHPDSGLLSAVGMGLAGITRERSVGVYRLVHQIGSSHLNAGELNAGELSDGGLNAGELNAGELSAGELNDGELSAGDLSDGDLSDGGLSDGGLDDGVFGERDLEATIDSMRREMQSSMLAEGMDLEQTHFSITAELRYEQTNNAISISWPSVEMREGRSLGTFLQQRYLEEHSNRFGFQQESDVELVALHFRLSKPSTTQLPNIRQETMSAIGRLTSWTNESESFASVQLNIANRTHRIYSGGGWCDGWKMAREALPVNRFVDGPGILTSSGHTTVIDVGWRATQLSDGTLLCSKSASGSSFGISANANVGSQGQVVDPVLREVVAQRLASIASQMGTSLQQSAMSVNIRERRDFSCAVFDAEGRLVANAPHVPVHLGAMGQTVRQMMLDFPRMHPGDCFVSNDPYRGGSHLPDVTVITPVFNMKSMQLQFFVASRAHHSEIGGIAPGSMTPNSRCLGDEGVILSALYLSCQGVDCRDEIRTRLKEGLYPSRDPELNLAEINAQQAANRRGEHLLAELCEQFSYSVVNHYMKHIRDVAAEKTRRWIATLSDQERTFSDALDDGSKIVVRIRRSIDEDQRPNLVVDFEGTSGVHPGNFNANPSIVTAAVLYSIRCQLNDSLPLNDGVMECIDLRIPTGMLNPPTLKNVNARAAVAAGNVETSQRIVDCVLGALGGVAASQGTMNNFLFGDSTFGYYETLCGGSGATADGPGASAVQTHMTNTLLTDIEVLETRYPVRVERFGIRGNSGGQGRQAGGDGVVREVTALRPLTVSLLTSRRGENRPYGVAGGLPGQAGHNRLRKRDGTIVELGACEQLEVLDGETVIIETPGGGGYGDPAMN
jgi:5-oxoprolinase (ATP-hydrolysing)